ncbi:3109_t:CDS:2, partial [Racocetra fulgida]
LEKYYTEFAVYQIATKEFAKYKFKTFYIGESLLIEELTKKTITMIIGCFAFKDGLNLNIKPNFMNGKTTNLLSIYKYNPKGRHSNIAKATHRQTIISVAGELIFVKKSVFVLCETIEWNYPMQENSKSQACDEVKHLMKIAEIFESKNQNQQIRKVTM